jgi:hypothetical protein
MIEIIEIGVGRRRTDMGRKLYQVVLFDGKSLTNYGNVKKSIITIEPEKAVEKLKKIERESLQV